MSEAVVIRRADWVVAWDESRGDHVYLRNADVAFAEGRFSHVGGRYEGPAAAEISGDGVMVMPGLIDIHSHLSSEPGNKGLLEELGSPKLGQSSLYEFMPVFRVAEGAAAVATQAGVAEMLRSGVTTVVDLSGARPGWDELLASTGIRAVLCPMYRSAVWRTPDGHSVEYTWDEKAGEAAFQTALDAVDTGAKHPSGRIGGMLSPAQLDTCTPELLRDSLAEAKRRGMKMHIHAAQSLVEFEQIVRRHGKTPIEYLDHLGLLGPDTIVAHGIFLNDHPMVHWPEADDFGLLKASGASVAHCPTVFCRRGIALNDVHRYHTAGIGLGIGTDTFPHNLIEEMRHACLMGRVGSGKLSSASTAEAFAAATHGGAAMLGRPDLGRVAVGAAADFSLVDLTHPAMRPLRDPLRSLIYTAADRAVRDVFVAGEKVVENGQALHVDEMAALDALQGYQEESIATVGERDWAGRSIDQMSPTVYPVQ